MDKALRLQGSAGALPLALARAHRSRAPGEHLSMHLVIEAPEPGGAAEADGGPEAAVTLARDLLVGGGFVIVGALTPDGHRQRDPAGVRATVERARTLPDVAGPGMRLLICGLNPSLHAADAGVGFVTASNRFWPAAQAAGLVQRDRDPMHALTECGVGFTDLAKRATTRADALEPHEYRDGFAHLERMVRRLRPGAVAFVGLAGWRAAVDRRATAGPQPVDVGGRPAYVLPSTSGLNGRTRLPDLVAHLAAAARLGL